MKPLTYVAVDTEALGHNLRQVRSVLEPDTALMAVVKANGYGHGLELAARAGAAAGADWLGVSTLEEGTALREADISLPILVFLPYPEEYALELIASDLSATIISEEQLVGLARTAERAQIKGHFHLYVDGGLGRPGAGADLFRLIELAAGFSHLTLDGVYLHMDAQANPQASLLEVVKPGAELRVFAGLVQKTAQQQLGRQVLVHAAASALTLNRTETHLDMVRVGTLLYGQYPASVRRRKRTLNLRRALELRSTVVATENLPRGATVGYGAEYRCPRETRIGLLPVGYASGVGTLPASLARRRYSGLRGKLRSLLRGEEEKVAIVAGQPAPILGRMAMDWCCVDLTALPEVQVGTEVSLPGQMTMLDVGLPRVEVPLSPPDN